MRKESVIPKIRIGNYRHNKSGNEYQVLGVASHTESNEYLVIYKPLYETTYELFARPVEMFKETVEIEGQVRPRFEYISG